MFSVQFQKFQFQYLFTTSLHCYIKYTPVQKQLLCKTECDNLLVLCEKQSIKTVRGQYHTKTGNAVECSKNICLKDSTGKKVHQ